MRRAQKQKKRGAEINAAELRQLGDELKFFSFLAEGMKRQGATEEQIHRLIGRHLANNALRLIADKSTRVKRTKITAGKYAAEKKKARTRKELASMLGVSPKALRDYERKQKEGK